MHAGPAIACPRSLNGIRSRGQPVEGNLLDSGLLTPVQNENGTKCFGDCWVWTSSAYLGYPGFRPLRARSASITASS